MSRGDGLTVARMLSMRKGPEVFRPRARLLDFMRQADVEGLINLAAGVPSPSLLPDRVLRECFDRACRNEGKKIFAYHAPEGDRGLKEIIAKRLNGRGVEVSGEDLVMTTGCTQALHTAIAANVEAGSVVACEFPAYYGMLELLSAAGARILPLPTDIDKGIRLDEAEGFIRRWKPKTLVICSSLSNPTGATVPEKERDGFVSFCRKRGIRLIEDDIYADLVDGGAPPPLRAYDDGKTVLYVTSFSKSVAPGLRVGCALPGRDRELFAEIKCREDLHSSVVSETTLREYFLDVRSVEHLASFKRKSKRRRGIARRAILDAFPEGTKVSNPRGGYMLWVVLPKAVNLKEVQAKALKKKIAFAHGEVFFCRSVPQRYMRINCAKAGEGELNEGLRVLGKLLRR